MITMVTAACMAASAQETFLPLEDGKAPQTFEALWGPFDPRAEPLDVEVLKEWEEDGVVLNVLRYRIGIFKGQKAMMAAVYGYPKGGENLPGLVQMHGGGQYAHHNACLTNAKRGYATISISWAGRISAPGYNVNPGVVKLFWEGETNSPQYRVTTDWGAVDGYHAPSRYAHGFSRSAPHEHTLDDVDSPRNDSWFLCTVGARRALTFLERQPEVDGDKLGVYGHSMGGKLTVMTAGSDDRVKAAAPSCGGVSHRGDKDPLISAMVCDDAYLKRITCPIVFLSPANDFHGRIEDQQTALTEIKSKAWRVSAAAHHQHQDTAEYEVATQLWFDQVLKNNFFWPETPAYELTLKTADGVPVFSVSPDVSRELVSVDFYYTQQAGEKAAERFWHHVAPTPRGREWAAPVPILDVSKPLWVYANVVYPLDAPVTGAGYYYGTYTTEMFNLSSPMAIATPEQLKAAGVKATMQPSLLIEDFGADWEKEWFSYRKGKGLWERNTRRLNDSAYMAPAFAKLAFGVQSDKAGKLIVQLDKMTAEVDVRGGPDWQEVVLFPTDFSDKDGGCRLDWEGVVTLRLAVGHGFPESSNAPFNLRSLRWSEGTRAELNARRKVKLLDASIVDDKTCLDRQYADVVKDGYKTVMNTWLDGSSPLVVDGKTYPHGLSTHASSEILFFLGGEYKQFRAIAQAWSGASVGFEVYVDDAKVFESGLLRALQTAPIDLSVANAQELKLVVTDGGNGKGGDHASWVDAHLLKAAPAAAGSTLPTPPEVWQDYDPDAGDFKEEIVREEALDGIYYKDAYISAYINGEEVRVYCTYAVKVGAKNAPGLMDVHGWYGAPRISMDYVNDGWAVLAHGYAGYKFERRPHYTKYPEALSYGNMKGPLVNSKLKDGSSITDPSQASDYVWYAIQRRALSYLLAQGEVDPDRIGAKGYSYGGTTMWNMGMDPRVKAIVAYFGIGWLEYYRTRGVWMYEIPPKTLEKTPGEELYLSAIAPQAHVPYIKAASLWLNGSNDHHGGHERGCETFKKFQPGVPWDFAIQARGHHNTEKLGDDCKLWLEKHVLGKAIFWPARPVSAIELDGEGVPEFHITPASPGRITELKAYYALKNPVSFGRAWRDAEAVRDGNTWVAKLPVLNVDDYVFGFANIRYNNNCVVSSDFEAVIPSKLGNAVATDKRSDMISEGTGMWKNVAPVEGVGGIKGFRALDNRWGTSSTQFSDPKWKAPKGASLTFKFYCTQPQTVTIEANRHYAVECEITASDEWQAMTLPANRLMRKGHNFALRDWSEINEVAIKPKPGTDITKVVFAEFKWVVHAE